MTEIETRQSGLKVVKFGGTSNATAESVRQISAVIDRDPTRRSIVVSAPGAADTGNPLESFRVTRQLRKGVKDPEALGPVWQRFDALALNLLGEDERYRRVQESIEDSRRRAQSGDKAFIESRGEHIQARILAEYRGVPFVDPASVIFLERNGTVHQRTYESLRSLQGEFVMAGYYGTNIDTGEIQLMGDGSSDLTGAIVARGQRVKIYENWTDVDGVLSADPRIVKVPTTPKGIEFLTYEEMEGLAYRGAGILQMDAVGPARDARIEIDIKNTFNPTHPGTRVVDDRHSSPDESIIGIASKKDLVSFQISKAGMNKSLGAIRDIAGIFASHKIPVEQSPGEMDSLSFICDSSKLNPDKVLEVREELYTEFGADDVRPVDNIGLIALVGRRIKKNATGINAILYPALSAAHIKTGAHVQSESGVSIVFSVDSDIVDHTVNTVYDAFLR